MSTIEERFALIENSILREAGEQVAKLETQRENFRKSALEKAENEILKEMYGKIQDEISDIRGDATRTVARTETVARQNLLLRREEITKAVFQSVKNRLLAYAKTEEYREFMQQLSQNIAQRYPLENSVVLLRRDDYHMAAEMDKIFGGKCRIMADEAIQIGGIKLMNQSVGIFVDETLDGRLEEQKPWFYSNSGLTIN
ncbi:MAG: V-type ATP synthase subunit E [Angelakisella sp.]